MDKDDQEFVVLPAEAIKFLPDEWREHIRALKEDGEATLEIVDANLKIVSRLIHAMPTITSLRYIHHRLASLKYEPTLEWILESDMLTLAFVTTYTRLIDGGLGSGVSRKSVPASLRPMHDWIIEVRNKRYAHNVGHDSITGTMEIGFEGDTFDITAAFKMGFYVQGAKEWAPLVAFLDDLLVSRLQAQLVKLKEKTGREWTFPRGPPPPWVSPVSANE